MKKLRFLFLITFSLFLLGCKQVKYVVRVQPSLFDELVEFGIEKTIFQNEKILIELTPALSLEKDDIQIASLRYSFQNSDMVNKVSGLEKTLDFQEELYKSWIIEKTCLFPCVDFQEDLPSFSQADKDKKISFYKLDKIPEGKVALAYENNGNKIYAHDGEYPFFEYKEGELFIKKLNKKNLSKKDLLAYEELDKWFKNLSIKCKYSYNPPEIAFVSAVGDIMIARGVEDTMIYEKKPDSIFTNTLEVLQKNDVTIGNLEGVVTRRSKNAVKTYTFKFKKAALPYLKIAGFNYFMLTNNHSYDYGEEGFKDTLKAFSEYDIKTSGAGLTKAEAEKWSYFPVKSQNIAIQSCGAYPVERSGFNGKKTASASDKRAGILWAGEDFIKLVEEESKKDSFIIVNVHGGLEYVKTPSEDQKRFYKQLCDAGADVVFGSHPHVLQPIEFYNGSLIVWSLGNFVFNGMQKLPGAQDSMIIRLGTINNKLVYYEKYPAQLDRKIVKLK